MISLSPYINFKENCREAMTFYKSCFGGELELRTFADFPGEAPPGAKDLIMHSALKSGPLLLMASDCPPGMEVSQDNNIQLSLNFDNIQECEKLFASLGVGGKILMPLQETSWSKRFGMLRCRFGMQWMFNCEG